MKTLILLSLLALSACATTYTSPTQYYRAAGQTDRLAISGTLLRSPGMTTVTNTVDIFINGRRVTGGEFSGGSAEFFGDFDGKPVSADCSTVLSGDLVNVRCVVYVSGERAATL